MLKLLDNFYKSNISTSYEMFITVFWKINEQITLLFYYKYELLLSHNTFWLVQSNGAELSVAIVVHLKCNK